MADNVTLDCKRAVLQGTNIDNSVGIRLEADNITVRFCDISNYESGIALNGTRHSTIERNDIFVDDMPGTDARAIETFSGPVEWVTIQNNRIDNEFEESIHFEGNDSTIEDNDVIGHIHLLGSRNVVKDNRIFPALFHQDFGTVSLTLLAFTDETLYEGNTIDGRRVQPTQQADVLVIGVGNDWSDNTFYATRVRDFGTNSRWCLAGVDLPRSDVLGVLNRYLEGSSLVTEVDHDSDGLNDGEEFDLGTNCADPDTDDDALLDGWEVHGIDADENGTVDLDLRFPGPDVVELVKVDPLRKDVFVELDWIGGFRPDEAVLLQIVKAFDEAPVLVPGGTPGIGLHYVLDESIPNQPDCVSDRPGFAEAMYDNYFSGDLARNMSFTYVIAVDRIAADNDATCGGDTLGGYAYLPGSRLSNIHVVAVGQYRADFPSDGEKREAAMGATFMQELGHNLGLCHQGPLIVDAIKDECEDAIRRLGNGQDETYNNKPNYLSVMNYRFLLGLIHEDGPITLLGLPLHPQDTVRVGILDYAKLALSPLNEQNLNENDGIKDGGAYVGYGTAWDCSFLGDDLTARVPYTAPLNWNCNIFGSEAKVDQDINGDDMLSMLRAENDWENLIYSCPNSLHGRIGTPATWGTWLSGCENSQDAMATLLPGSSVPHAPIQELDYDLDGIANGLDTCPNDPNPGQGDLDADGAGDLCDPENTVAIEILPNLVSWNRATRGRGTLLVAVLTTDSFDAATIDVESLRFGPGNAAEKSKTGRPSLVDIDGDGDTDALFRFNLGDIGFKGTETDACLTGQIAPEIEVVGCDDVAFVGRGLE